MISLIYPLLVAFIAVPMSSEHWAWAWILLPFNVLVVPAIDHTIRLISPGCEIPALLKRWNYIGIAFWIYAVAQTAAATVAIKAIAASPFDVLVFMGLASSVGIMTGTAGITAAHELIHRRRASDRALGVWLLSMTTYAHFRIEHVLGHHRWFGTDRDRSSAAFGESFPKFFGRALIGGVKSAWSLECERLQNQNSAPWSQSNRMLHYSLLQIGIYLAVAIAAGWLGIVFFLLQSLVAVHLLEAVNYVQHYGLRRAVGRNGRIARPMASDSWDSNDPISTLLVFNLSTHSAHHVRPGVTCADLSPEACAPRLPASFFLMVFIALIPPLWHSIMDGRVRQLSQGKSEDGEKLVSHELFTSNE